MLKTTVAGTHTLALAPIVGDGPRQRTVQLPLISERFNLSRGVEALEHARTRPALKVPLDVEPPAP